MKQANKARNSSNCLIEFVHQRLATHRVGLTLTLPCVCKKTVGEMEETSLDTQFQ